MESEKMKSGEYFKTLKIVHFALAAGIVFFMLMSIFLQYSGFGTIGKEVKNGLLIAVPLFALAGIFASNIVFKQKLKIIAEHNNLKEKMIIYRSAIIVKLALVEGPAFFTVIAYLITGDLIFLGIIIVLLLIFLIYTPTRNKLINELELSKSDSDLISNPDSEIK